MSEFYSHSVPAPPSHPLDARLMEAVQFLRNWSAAPVRLTSTYRTAIHQMALYAEGKTTTHNSYHMTGQAIDFMFIDTDTHRRFCNDVLSQGEIFNQLRRVYGIRGFGLYDSFVHLDTGEKEGLHTDFAGKYRLWDYRSTSKKKA